MGNRYILVLCKESFCRNLRPDFSAGCGPEKPDIHGHVGKFFGVARCGKRWVKFLKNFLYRVLALKFD